MLGVHRQGIRAPTSLFVCHSSPSPSCISGHGWGTWARHTPLTPGAIVQGQHRPCQGRGGGVRVIHGLLVIHRAPHQVRLEGQCSKSCSLGCKCVQQDNYGHCRGSKARRTKCTSEPNAPHRDSPATCSVCVCVCVMRACMHAACKYK